MAKKAPADGKIVERMVPLDELILDPANAREHGPDSIRVLKDSLSLFGQPEAIVVQKSTGKVIAGNGRVAAARELGWAEIRANVVDVDNVTASAMALTLNRTAERSGWNADVLAETIRAVEADGFDVTRLGWEADEIREILGDPVEIGQPPDPNAEWVGMPEYENEDQTPFRTLRVHFQNQADLDDFARLIGQTITDRTKWLWHPKSEQVTHADKVYGDE